MSEIGRRSQVLIGREETTYGTLSAALQALAFSDLSVSEPKNILPNAQAYGDIVDEREGSAIGSESSEITVSGNVGASTIGHLLYAAFGTLVSQADTPVASSDTHTFDVDMDSNEHPSYSLVWKDGVHQRAILGARMVSLSFNIVAGEWVTFEAVFQGRKTVVDTTTPITYSAEENFTAAMATLKMGTTLASLGSAICMSEGTITFTKNASPHFCWGSTDASKIINNQWGVEIEGTLLWEDATEYALYQAHTTNAMQIKLTTIEYVTGTTPYDLEFEFDIGTIRTFEIPKPLDDKVESNFMFKGTTKNSTGKVAVAVLVNGTDGAATY